METFAQNLRFALRSLRKNPVIAVVVVVTLGLGIGATSALFSVVHGVLLQPLPYPQPQQLVRVFDSSTNNPTFPMAPGNFVDHREALAGDGEMAVYMREDVELTAGQRSERLHGMVASAGFFRLLRHDLVLGRDFELADEKADGELIAILSHRFWQRHLGGEETAVGRPITLNGAAHTVVGVLAPGLEHVGGNYRSLPQGTVVDVWRPIELDPNRRNWHFLNAIVRLTPSLIPEQAAARMNVTAERLAAEYPDTNEAWRIAVVPLAEEIVGAVRPMIQILMGAIVLVLAIATVNVANLLLVRATARRGEMGIRRALGAGRSSLLRQVMTENMVLASLGGLLGLALARLGVAFLRAWGPDNLPRLHAIDLDPRVLGFTASVTILVGLVVGVAPALRMSRTPLRQTISGSSGAVSGGRNRPRQILVVAQLALATVLLVGAGLLVESFRQLRLDDPGFDSENVVTADIALPRARYAESAEQISFFQRLCRRLEAVPGVVAAGAGSNLPWTGYDENMSILAEDWVGEADREAVRTRFHIVTPGYFRSLGVPIASGREFDSTDDSEAPQRVVISQRLAEVLWGDEDAVGRRLTWSSQPEPDDIFTVVGVVGNLKDGPGGALLLPSMYMPHAQQPWNASLKLAVRTTLEPAALIPALRQELRVLDADLPLANVRTLAEVASGSYATPRFLSLLLAGFAAIALVLAIVGLYAVISYSVGRRVREMAVRAALGARASQIVALVLAQGLWLVAFGAGLGVAGALGLVGFLQSLLYGVEARQPWVFFSVVILLAAVALVASLVPAHRAGRVDPAAALRLE